MQKLCKIDQKITTECNKAVINGIIPSASITSDTISFVVYTVVSHAFSNLMLIG